MHFKMTAWIRTLHYFCLKQAHCNTKCCASAISKYDGKMQEM